MEFSIINLKELLYQSRGLQLLSDDKRQKYIDYILASPEVRQRKVFEILTKTKEESNQAEKRYNEKISEAFETFKADVDALEKKGISELRKNAEDKEKKQEEEKMNNLLDNLQII